MAFTTFVASTTIRSAEVNANFAYCQGDIVPHSYGALANNQFTLGTTSAIWKTLYANSIDAASLVLSGGATIYTNLNLNGSGNNTGIQFFTSDHPTDIAMFIYQDNNAASETSAYLRINHGNTQTVQIAGSRTTLRNTFFNANNNFGIGTVSPSQPLEVVGAAVFGGNVNISGTANVPNLTVTAAGYLKSANIPTINITPSTVAQGLNMYDIEHPTDKTVFMFSNSGGPSQGSVVLRMYSGASTTVQLASGRGVGLANFFGINGYNTGFGTRNPSQTLEVAGGFAFNGNLVAGPTAHTDAASAGSVSARIPIVCSGVTLWIEARQD